eukprot:413730-Amphidinium_carterae.1
MALVLSALLSSRDPLTLSRHRASLELFSKWSSSLGYTAWIPESVDVAVDYLEHLWKTNVP